ncbi:MAG: MFS transporter, partial [OCS116 cluster bacterium]|nr:MFS transporter [OCS116 cluster bacterium]
NLGNIIADAGHYGFRNKTIATMLMGAGCMSLAFFTFQSFWVPFVKPMLNGEFATSIIGFLTFGLFLSQAMGTMLAKPAINLCRGNMAKALAGLTFISAAGLLAISFSSDIIYFALTLVLFSLFIGSMHSPYASLFHDNLPNDKRSTLLSLVSLVERLGGLVGLLFIGYIAEYFGIPTAFQIGSIFILVAGILYLTLPHNQRNISNH